MLEYRIATYSNSKPVSLISLARAMRADRPHPDEEHRSGLHISFPHEPLLQVQPDDPKHISTERKKK